jgi:hypothetical protein
VWIAVDLGLEGVPFCEIEVACREMIQAGAKTLRLSGPN